MDLITLEALQTFPKQLAAHYAAIPAGYKHWAPPSWEGIPSERFTAIEQICHVRDIELDGYQVRFARTLNELKDFLRPYISYIPHRVDAPSWRQSFDVLGHYGCRPNTVFDIGVAYGTYDDLLARVDGQWFWERKRVNYRFRTPEYAAVAQTMIRPDFGQPLEGVPSFLESDGR